MLGELAAARSVVKISCACSWILSQHPCAAPRTASALHRTGEQKTKASMPATDVDTENAAVLTVLREADAFSASSSGWDGPCGEAF